MDNKQSRLTRYWPTMSGMRIPSPFPIEKYRNLKGPILDLRSPGEFDQGHWPGAINLPLFSNEERALIGTSYKKRGRKDAILLGLELVSPKLSELKKSLELIKTTNVSGTKPSSKSVLRMYCWRGGMRSASVAWLASVLDLNPVLLQGGYKSYRKWVLEQFEKDWSLNLLGGKTGTGKTDLLLSLTKRGISIIDLEGLASHRGSSFGALGLPNQPTTEHYENKIAESLQNQKRSNKSAIWMEAESANLGRCRIPHGIFKQMKIAPVVEIKRTKEERIAKLVQVYGNQGIGLLKEATIRISRRLGPQRTTKAIEAIDQKRWGDACAQMLDYYDKCYDKELSRVHNRTSIEISGLNSEQAAELLIEKGLIY